MAGLGLIPGFGGSNQGSVQSPPSTVQDLTLRWPPFYGQKIPPPSAVYALDLGAGSFVETGNAATFAVGFPLGSGSFAEAGNALGLAVGFPLGSGSFAETGNAVRFALGFPLGFGSFVETGRSAGFAVGMPLGPGSFAETGYSATIVRRFNLALGYGSFAETGYSAGISLGETLGYGSFEQTGYPAEIAANRAFGLGFGAYTLTGYSIDIASGKSFQLGAGSFALAGYSLTIVIPARRLNAGSGGFMLTGYSLGITSTGGFLGDPGLPSGTFQWPRYPEDYSTERAGVVRQAFSKNWEPFLQVANVRCTADYSYNGLVSQTFMDLYPVKNQLTNRLAIDFVLNDGRTFMVDLPDDMLGIYRGVLRQLIP